MDLRGFTDAVEVIDMHTHICRSEAHGHEMYSYFMMGFPVMSGPPTPPCLSTLEEAERLRTQTGVRHLNLLMFTWSGLYYRTGQYMLPDDPADREQADRELRARITQRIRDNNQWAVDTVNPRVHLSTFCGIDPVLMDEQTLLQEVEDKTRQGAIGVKMVPLDLGIRGDDARLWPLYDYLQANELPIQTECGDIPGTSSRPKFFAKALAEFPQLKIIFSHMGHSSSFREGTDAEFLALANEYENVRGDLSLRLLEVADDHVSPTQLVQYIRDVGSERVMYGSNYSLNELLRPDPGRGPEDPPQISQSVRNLETFAALPLTDKEQRAIAGSNFRQFVGLPARPPGNQFLRSETGNAP